MYIDWSRNFTADVLSIKTDFPEQSDQLST